VRSVVSVPRFACRRCDKTISAAPQGLQKNKQYCLDALFPLLMVYLLQWKSYEHCVWYPLHPSTLWRWMNMVCQKSQHNLMTLQRRLVDAAVPLMSQAAVSRECPNASKARLSIMRDGLTNLKAFLDLAGQFLPKEVFKELLLPTYLHQRYPPQSSQCRLF
jgi:hypothetical protein